MTFISNSFRWITGNATHSLKQTDKLEFIWSDYGVFGSMLFLSALIGVYFGCFGSKQRTATEYLLGDKSMGVIPVGISLVASHISGITVLGVPAEVYTYGTQYIASILVTPVVGLLIIYFFLPVFYKLQLTSSYEYLQHRFGISARLLASFIYTFNLIFYIPIVVYVPALAFNQVSGVNLHSITPFVCLICIFYTVLGGLKAVVWTDTVQQVIMLGSTLAVIYLGFQYVGSPESIYNINKMGGRLEIFNMNPDPTERNTFWTIFIGITFSWLSTNGISQGMVQRLLSVSTLKKSQTVVIIFIFGYMFSKVLAFLTGVIIFAKYHGCDPLTTKKINRPDQLLPFFIMDVASSIPGLPGLFVAGVFSAALSTMSSYLNTVSGTIFEDFISKLLPGTITEERAGRWMKGIVAVVGIICVLMVFVIEKLGPVIQVTASLGGMTNGVLLGIFILGMSFPWANLKGALTGSIVGFAFSVWMVLGAQTAIAQGDLRFPWKPVYIDQCEWIPINQTSINETIYNNQYSVPSFDNFTKPFGTPVGSQSTTEATEGLFPLYKISFYLYTFFGTFVTIIVGLIVSFLTGAQDPATIDPDLITPILHRWVLPPKNKRIRIKSTHIGSKRPSEGHMTISAGASAAATVATTPLIIKNDGTELKTLEK